MDLADALSKLDNAQQGEVRIRNAYRSVFGSGLGPLILEDMLWNLYFLQKCETVEQQALCNYAKSLLSLVYGQPVESHKLRNLIKRMLEKKR